MPLCQYGFIWVTVCTYVGSSVVCLPYVWCLMVCILMFVHEYCMYASKVNRFSFKQATFLRPQRKSTVWVFLSRSETMAPFIKGRWGHGGGSEKERQRGIERGGERENRLLHIGLLLFWFSTVFATCILRVYTFDHFDFADKKEAKLSKLWAYIKLKYLQQFHYHRKAICCPPHFPWQCAQFDYFNL